MKKGLEELAHRLQLVDGKCFLTIVSNSPSLVSFKAAPIGFGIYF